MPPVTNTRMPACRSAIKMMKAESLNVTQIHTICATIMVPDTVVAPVALRAMT